MRCYKSLLSLIVLSTILAACSTAPKKNVADDVALQIARKNNCLACHSIDRKIVGPSFNQIAARYRGQDVQQQLFVRLRRGGAGTWGTMPEPPQIAISDNDLKLIILWITELDGTQSPSVAAPVPKPSAPLGFAPVKSQLEQFREDISSYLAEQGKNPQRIIKYSDSNGNVARAVLNPDRARILIEELKKGGDYSQKLKDILEQHKPISRSYSNAFTQFPGQYDAEYLDDFEFNYQLINASTKIIRDLNTAAIKDENMRAMLQATAKMMQSINTLILKSLEQQIREKKFSNEFTPIAVARLNRLQASQIQPADPDTKSTVPVSTTPASPAKPNECMIKVFQKGTEIKPVATKKAMTFKLAPDEFKIEVAQEGCNPSIALVNEHELAYITETPLIFGTGAYWVAGDIATADMLGTAAIGRNPRTTIDEEIQLATSKVAWAKQQYQELCKSLSYCPTPVKHYATAWPFTDPATRTNRGFAEFKRFDNFGAMDRAAGRLLNAVVYTNWKTLSDGEGWNQSRLYVLKPHAVVLDFQH